MFLKIIASIILFILFVFLTKSDKQSFLQHTILCIICIIIGGLGIWAVLEIAGFFDKVHI